LISDPLRTDGSYATDEASPADRDAKIEQLLLVGLDHYFGANYELAINVWTRALFLDRNHPRARAYIERARSALAERQRESEELLQTGVAAFNRGDADEARRLLQAAIDRGAPSDEALAVLERLNRLEPAMQPLAPTPTEPKRGDRAPRAAGASTASFGSTAVVTAAAIGAVAVLGWAAWASRIEWRFFGAPGSSGGQTEAPARAATPVARELPLPLPRRGEEALARARGLAASGHLHDALAVLGTVRATDPQRADADQLRGEIQRQLLELTSLPEPAAERDKVERRNR
jgi:tetratricopeptide (TPR) repeat protein